MIIILVLALLSFSFLGVYFYRWKDDRPDLGGFGGRK